MNVSIRVVMSIVIGMAALMIVVFVLDSNLSYAENFIGGMLP